MHTLTDLLDHMLGRGEQKGCAAPPGQLQNVIITAKIAQEE